MVVGKEMSCMTIVNEVVVAAELLQPEGEAEPKEKRNYCTVQLHFLGLCSKTVDDLDPRQVQVLVEYGVVKGLMTRSVQEGH